MAEHGPEEPISFNTWTRFHLQPVGSTWLSAWSQDFVSSTVRSGACPHLCHSTGDESPVPDRRRQWWQEAFTY